jgi:anti-anti-sigma factor
MLYQLETKQEVKMFFINHIDFGKDSTSIIEMDGELTSESSPDFDEYIGKLLDNNVIYMLIDMKNVGYISSEGIGALLMVQKKISKKSGLVIFFNLNNEISSLFRLLGFDKVLTIASDRADALQILDKHIELFYSKDPYDNNDFDFIEQKDKEDKPAQLNVKLPKSKPVVKEENEINSFKNFVIECIKCNSLIRINEFGDHLCPFCSAEFTVTDEKKAVFKIK